jgi:hypothetical protein
MRTTDTVFSVTSYNRLGISLMADNGGVDYDAVMRWRHQDGQDHTDTGAENEGFFFPILLKGT